MDDDAMTEEEHRIEARRFDLAMRRLLAGDLTEAEAAELDAINATANARQHLQALRGRVGPVEQ